MDELELLKRDWKKQEATLPKYEQKELYQMLQKKSTSIVRWIFIISIIEFSLLIILDLWTSFSAYNELLADLSLEKYFRGLVILNYMIIVVFVSLFFFNYRKINVTDNVRKLMKNILTARRTVKFYIWINIVLFAFSFILIMYKNAEASLALSSEEMTIYMVISFVILLFFVLFFLLYYRIVYGILTRKLKKNYNDLKKIDIQD